LGKELTSIFIDDTISKVLLFTCCFGGYHFMSYEKVSQAKKIVVGTKQTVKALKTGKVVEVIVAEDADPILIGKVVEAAKEANVPVILVDSMIKLGKSCGIEVGATTVAINI